MNAEAESFNLADELQDIERQVNIALNYVNNMRQYDSIWHPKAKRGVSRPITDEVAVALQGILTDTRRIQSKVAHDVLVMHLARAQGNLKTVECL